MRTKHHGAARPPLNPAMLVWAREWRKRSIDEAAKRVGISETDLQDWEAGKSLPTVRQARALAKFYDRPFIELFYKKPPVIQPPQLLPDFRMHRGAADPHDIRELQEIQSWAEELRLNALDLYEALDEAPPLLPDEARASISDDPELIAARVRNILRFPIEEQLSLRASERENLAKILRLKFESVGVLTLRESALKQFGARGLCIFAVPLPVIVFGAEAKTAQAFTLAHEFGHVVLQQSAISAHAPVPDAPERRPESWCDKFAGSFLIPSDSLKQFIETPARPHQFLEDSELQVIARQFGVSKHAALIRLVQLGYVDSAFYWEHKRNQFLREEGELTSGGRSEYYGSRYRSANGDLYTGLVIEAWQTGLITNHSAAEFMGIKNPKHLHDIKDRFGAK